MYTFLSVLLFEHFYAIIILRKIWRFEEWTDY